ncbi:hypothetical protein F4808DRAFT_442580 [Astrocystis sublimbata]|nr:hypothetical protein F4808DRAFT_442580 [Astrocystis sublimbata]
MQTSFAIITLLSVAGSAIADSCKQGGTYCGQSLLNRGNYHDHIVAVLTADGQPTDDAHITNSQFTCGSNGDITFIQFCQNGCNGVGNNDADTCI